MIEVGTKINNRWVRGERNFDELFANVDKRRKVYA